LAKNLDHQLKPLTHATYLLELRVQNPLVKITAFMLSPQIEPFVT